MRSRFKSRDINSQQGIKLLRDLRIPTVNLHMPALIIRDGSEDIIMLFIDVNGAVYMGIVIGIDLHIMCLQTRHNFFKQCLIEIIEVFRIV